MEKVPKIKTARIEAKVSQTELADALGRSQNWICHAENGRVPVSAELEAHMLLTIARLAALRAALRRSKADLVEDLRLPPAECAAIR